jgi:flagellin
MYRIPCTALAQASFGLADVQVEYIGFRDDRNGTRPSAGKFPEAVPERRAQKRREFKMALSILNNIPSLAAQNQLAITGADLQKTLFRLASGSRINSGADDAAGLAIADGLHANATALTQSARNANDGIGVLQVADGALGQITSLLDRAVTLATESSTDTVQGTGAAGDQRGALDGEYQAILTEIGNIGSATNYNGQAVFGGTIANIHMTDGSGGDVDVDVSTALAALTTTSLALNGGDLKSATNAQTALTAINAAIGTVASLRGNAGALINQLQAATNVMNNQVQNLTSAEDGIRAADMGQEVANLTKYSILNQTGISALAQANNMQQSVLKLLQ